jgi:hypothetical protein
VQPPRIFIPLLVWLLIQWLALALGAIGMRWSANYPIPGDLQSLRLLVVVQLAAATLLQGWLLRSSIQTLLCLVCIFPFIVAAGYLSGSPVAITLTAGAYVAIWISVLGIAHRYHVAPLCSTFVAFTTLLVLGIPAMDYLNREYGNGKSVEFGPIFDVFAILDGQFSPARLLAPALAFAAALVTRNVRSAP